jgi:hypothetical protein
MKVPRFLVFEGYFGAVGRPDEVSDVTLSAKDEGQIRPVWVYGVEAEIA